MTQPERISQLDFSAPRGLSGTANRAFSSWQSTACAILKECWHGLLGSNIELTPGRLDSSTAQKAIRELPDPGFAARMMVTPDGFSVFAVFSARMVQALVAQMLGTLTDEWPEVRALSPAESSMVELLFGEVARAFSLGWPDVEPLECHLQSVISRPLRSRVFAPDQVLVRSTVRLSVPVGSEDIILLFPKEGLTSLGITDTTPEEEETPHAAPQLRKLAEKLPVTMVIELGHATLSLVDMNNLSVGDVLVLDQPFHMPLEARIKGKLQWLGHPCRLGQQQGFHILASAKD